MNMTKKSLRSLLLALAVLSTITLAGLATAQEGEGSTEPAAEAGGAPAAYTAECGRCHNADGSATRIGERLGSSHLGSAEVQALGADGIRAAIVEGREGMPAETELSEADLTAIVEYTLTLSE
jgi:mono/diheme cytochrome c family protein